MKDALHRLAAPLAWAALGSGLLLAAFPARSQSPELVDRIVAIVDEEAILLSDLEREIESYKFEAEAYGRSVDEEPATIRANMMARLVEVKLLVAQAKFDGIEISEEEINQGVARSLEDVIGRFGTRRALDEELARAGMTFADLEARNRELVRNRLYTSRMIGTHIRPLIEVREDEIRAFYEEHRDEVPARPARVTLSSVLVVPQPSQEGRTELDAKLAAITDDLHKGLRFEDIARKRSEGPNASRGGLVGSFTKGDLFHPLLEDAAWSLAIGEVSEPISTELGLHIIEIPERTETEVTLRQILLRVSISGDDWKAAEERALDVLRMARGGQDFAELVENYSDDPTSREQGGTLGEFPLDQLTPEFRTALAGLKTGEFTEPIRARAGYYLLRVDNRLEAASPGYAEVKERLRAAVEEQKIDAELKNFLQGLREKFYIDIKA